jgi:hypothetical protein
MSRAAFAVLLLGLLAIPGTASAYKVMTASQTGVELRWTAQPMKFNIHGTAAPGMTAAATQDAVRKAYLAWTSVSCTSFKTQDLGVVNLPWGDKEDYVNTHVWTSSWPPSYGQNALGITWTSYDPQSGKIFDADTHYNPGYPWSNTGSPTAIDAQSVATHEIGHQLGLDHTPVQTATMFYATGQGDTSQRSLDADDMAGVCYLYPSGQPLPPECTTAAQCAADETCLNQKCVPGGQKGYGSPCQSGKDCTSGICLEYNGTTFCSQGCDSQACPNGDKCFPVSGGTGIANACLPGSAAMGTKTLGQACTANPDCKTEICVSVPGKGYLCSQKCDTAKQDCPAGFTCATASTGGLCIPATTTPPPPPPVKKKLGETCTSSADCESDICAAIGGTKACVQLCELGKAGTCPAGFSCVPAGAKGACVKQGPPPPPAKGALGAECQKNEDCDKNLCASDAEGRLFCTELCDPAQGCPGEFDCVEAGAQYACSPRVTEQPLDEEGGGCGLAASTAPSSPERWILILLLPFLILALPRRQGRR